jgi:hypothetical protein
MEKEHLQRFPSAAAAWTPLHLLPSARHWWVAHAPRRPRVRCMGHVFPHLHISRPNTRNLSSSILGIIVYQGKERASTYEDRLEQSSERGGSFRNQFECSLLLRPRSRAQDVSLCLEDEICGLTAWVWWPGAPEFVIDGHPSSRNRAASWAEHVNLVCW